MIPYPWKYLVSVLAYHLLFQKHKKADMILKKPFLSFFFHVLFSHLIILQETLNPPAHNEYTKFYTKNLTNPRQIMQSWK
jgi:hypothetical protein